MQTSAEDDNEEGEQRPLPGRKFDAEAESNDCGDDAEAKMLWAQAVAEEEEEKEDCDVDERLIRFTNHWPPPAQVRASIIRTGHLVSFMSELSLSYFQDHELEFWQAHLHAFPKHVFFGSMCTGSGMDADVLYRLCDDLRSRGVNTWFENLFMCEMIGFKQQWLLRQEVQRRRKRRDNEPKYHTDTCCFVDAKDLANGLAGCCSHDTRTKAQIKGSYNKCRVKTSDIFTCGSSCKYFSHANRDRSHGSPATLLARLLNCNTREMHQSLTTFVAWRDYLRMHRPKVVLWENTDAFLDTPSDADDQALQSNLSIVLELLIALGYEAQPIRVSSNKYGTCQVRVRLFIIALLKESPWWRIRDSSDYDAVFARLLARLQRLQVEAPALRDCMLRDDDPVVVTELEAAKKRAASRKPDKSAKWRTDMIAFCAKHPTLRWGDVKAAKSSTDSPWFSALAERDQEIIAAMQYLHGERASVDASQSLDLCKFVKPPVSTLPCLLPNSSWWVPPQSDDDRAAARPLLGREMMCLQGFNMSEADVEGTTDANLADLAGNAFCGSVVAAILSSLFVSVPWTSVEEAEAEAARSAALASAMSIFRS